MRMVLAGVIASIALATIGIREWRLQPRGFSLDVLDIGQGTAALLTAPGNVQVLVDGGPDASVVEQLPRVMPFLDRTIELVVLSHPDSDHLTGLLPVLERYRVRALLLTGAPHGLPRYAALLELAAAKDIPVLPSATTRDIRAGGLSIRVLWPPPSALQNGNNGSLVLQASVNGHAVLLPGDIEETAEHSLVLSGADMRADILIVPHHGSRTSSSTGFLLAVRPTMAILSAGRNNRYGHPHADIVARYRALGTELRSTAVQGNVHIPLP